MSFLPWRRSLSQQRFIGGILERDAALGRSRDEEQRVALKQKLAAERDRFEEAFRNSDMAALHASALETQKLSRQMMLCDQQEWE